MRPNSIKLIYLLLCVIIFSSLGWSQYYEESYNYKSTYTDTIGPQWINVPGASNEQGKESSLTLHNGLPFFVLDRKSVV